MSCDVRTREDLDLLQQMAYWAARTVLMLRRDPSVARPSNGVELDRHLTIPAVLLANAHFREDAIATLFSIMRGVWEADEEVGTEVRCWT